MLAATLESTRPCCCERCGSGATWWVSGLTVSAFCCRWRRCAWCRSTLSPQRSPLARGHRDRRRMGALDPAVSSGVGRRGRGVREPRDARPGRRAGGFGARAAGLGWALLVWSPSCSLPVRPRATWGTAPGTCPGLGAGGGFGVVEIAVRLIDRSIRPRPRSHQSRDLRGGRRWGGRFSSADLGVEPRIGDHRRRGDGCRRNGRACSRRGGVAGRPDP